MEITQAIRARRSIRKYKPGQTIPQEQVELMLEAAMCAPSACNSRPWEFVVVENAELRREITKVHPYCRSLPDASMAIVVCGRPEALPDAPGEGFWPQDCAAATQNILLEAVGLGYGTCWCGLYPNMELADTIAKLLDVSSVPLSLIIVGVADERPNRRGLLDPARVQYRR
jgi:nitroreductase